MVATVHVGVVRGKMAATYILSPHITSSIDPRDIVNVQRYRDGNL